MVSQSGWGDIGQPLNRLDHVPRDANWLKCKCDKEQQSLLSHPNIVLPEGSLVIAVTGCGGSYWSQTGKIDLRLADGSTEVYFIKVC